MLRFTHALRTIGPASALLGIWLTLAAPGHGQEQAPPAPAQKEWQVVSEAPGAQEKKEAEPKDKEAKKEDESCKPFWQTHPRYPVLPKTSFFTIPPTGPGYYSLKDECTDNCQKNPPPFGYNRFAIYPFPFFNADFRYVDDPKKNKEVDCFEKMHRIHLGCDDSWLFGTGGEFRYRLNNEINARGIGRDNRYDLTRFRLFGDLWYLDWFRVYVEGLSSQSFGHDVNPLAIDRNFAELLNAFVDVKVFQEADGTPWYVRGGRQQLLFGSQRLVSPNDWANVPRTFNGVRGFRHTEKFDVDLWWAQPVLPNATRFDSSDREQNFAGAWTTYRPNKETTWDLYYLYLDNNAKYKLVPVPSPIPGPFVSQPFSYGPLAIDGPYGVHTLGTRFSGDYHNFLYDVEPMLQLGRRQDSDLIAGAVAVGGGYHFKDCPWNPVFWAYYDFASGSQDPLAGQLSTFNQLYPFGHYHFGWMDFIGRQNIQDTNFHLYLYPTKWITTDIQYHIFQLASATDALYGVAGGVSRFDPTGRAGRNVGQEVDFIMNFHLTKHQDILAAYSQLYFGSFMKNTGPGDSAETFWLMYTLRW